jgi:AGZA family xanthine/uracil permease-like MFS transporter
MKRLVKGDWDGLFALGLDNLLMLILMSSLCQGFLGFGPDLFYGRILPATAIGLVIGNLYYARLALQLAARENRDDVCAMPYGLNLITVYVYVFQVMYPAQQMALADGMDKSLADAAAWKAGIVACLGSGLIEFFGAFVVSFLQRITPRAALLAALAGIGVFFIGIDFVFRSYAAPIVGFSTLTIVLLIYFGRLRFRFGIPGGLVVLVVGSILAWIFYRAGDSDLALVGSQPLVWDYLGLHIPLPVVGDLFGSLNYLVTFAPIILPMGLINLVLSLQNIESAAAAGDRYPARPVLLTNGLGTIGASLFGSPFPTTIYIGHPGWKAIGARAGYSSLNAVFMTLICMTGALSVVSYFVPVEAGMAILIWIGLMMGAQAFQTTPQRHAAAVVMGLLPALGSMVALVVRNVLGSVGYGSAQAYDPALFDVMRTTRAFFAEGVFALDMGYVYTSMILAAATVCIIDQQFRRAACWFLSGAVLSAVGLIHSFEVTYADVVAAIFEPGWKWLVGYLIAAGILFAVPLLGTVEKTEEDS